MTTQTPTERLQNAEARLEWRRKKNFLERRRVRTAMVFGEVMVAKVAAVLSHNTDDREPGERDVIDSVDTGQQQDPLLTNGEVSDTEAMREGRLQRPEEQAA